MNQMILYFIQLLRLLMEEKLLQLPLDLRVIKDQPANKVLKVKQVKQVKPVPTVLLVHKVPKVHKVLKVLKVHKDR
jgi:hypothetical protein